MYLKEIELENFKSFGRKQRIPFLGGYTAITGPNGCGKSNISDAILFVLGPRSSRVIRAGKLTDLLFNGGKEKKPATECRVSLIFDNKDRLLPIQEDKVKLTRLVRLSDSTPDGYYSYFYINDKRSSLGEFDSLLANARISADGYNFVQQGDITHIVEMGNLERRRILDDIAGITRFDEEIQNAQKEQAVVEENLSRLAIIQEETRKALKQLEADRTGALKYRELKERHTVAQASIALRRKEGVEREIASLHQQLANYEGEKARLEAKRAELTKTLTEASEALVKVEAALEERGGEEARELKEKIDTLRVEIARAQDAAQTSQEFIQTTKEERKATEEEHTKLTEQLSALQAERKPLETKLAEQTKALAARKAKLAKAQEAAAKADSHLTTLQKEHTALQAALARLEEQLHTQTLEADRLTEKANRARVEIANLEEAKKTYEFELKDAEWSLKELRQATKSTEGTLRKLQETYQAKRNAERKLAQQVQELDQAVVSLTRRYNQLKAESDAADQVRRGYSHAVSSILEARDKGQIKGIHGTIAELADVEAKYETALNVAAGPRMQAIVVGDDGVAANCIAYLKKNKFGRATFLPLNKMMDGRPRGKAIMAAKESIGFALDLVKFEERYRAAFFYVFGDTVVVKDLDEARRLMGGVRLATLSGELAEASGAMVGGTLEETLLKFGAPSQSELDKVAAELRAATEHAEKARAELQALQAEVLALESQLREASTQGGGTVGQADVLQTKQKEFLTRLEALEEELGAKQNELAETLDALDTVKRSLASLQKDLEASKKKKESSAQRLLEATPEEVQREIKALGDEILTLTNETAECKAKVETLSTQIGLVEGRLKELAEGLAQGETKVKELQKKIKQSETKAAQCEVELTALQKMERGMGDALNSLRTKRDGLYKHKTDLESDLSNLETKLQTKADFFLGIQTTLHTAEEKLAEAEREYQAFATVKLPDKLPPLDELRMAVSECEAAMNAIGAVNLRAVEEYDEKRNRFDALKEEIKLLNAQKTNLLKLVAELNDKKRDGLMAVFRSVNENFMRVYAELSDGGEAELVLENEEDPLAGGLILRARPKGKKILRLEALSGGEKSLTALAFIVAIQQYQPSPFYLFDEVDMFLDGINAENVARAVKRNSTSAQFVQMSLRKVTLKWADHLIGVTMQQSGISDIIMDPNLREIAEELPEEEDRTAEEADA